VLKLCVDGSNGSASNAVDLWARVFTTPEFPAPVAKLIIDVLSIFGMRASTLAKELYQATGIAPLRQRAAEAYLVGGPSPYTTERKEGVEFPRKRNLPPMPTPLFSVSSLQPSTRTEDGKSLASCASAAAQSKLPSLSSYLQALANAHAAAGTSTATSQQKQTSGAATMPPAVPGSGSFGTAWSTILALLSQPGEEPASNKHILPALMYALVRPDERHRLPTPNFYMATFFAGLRAALQFVASDKKLTADTARVLHKALETGNPTDAWIAAMEVVKVISCTEDGTANRPSFAATPASGPADGPDAAGQFSVRYAAGRLAQTQQQLAAQEQAQAAQAAAAARQQQQLASTGNEVVTTTAPGAQGNGTATASSATPASGISSSGFSEFCRLQQQQARQHDASAAAACEDHASGQETKMFASTGTYVAAPGSHVAKPQPLQRPVHIDQPFPQQLYASPSTGNDAFPGRGEFVIEAGQPALTFPVTWFPVGSLSGHIPSPYSRHVLPYPAMTQPYHPFASSTPLGMPPGAGHQYYGWSPSAHHFRNQPGQFGLEHRVWY
jgi:hypothetical protein